MLATALSFAVPDGMLGLGQKTVAEKRRAIRHRTRLRPGRIFDIANNFLVDCSFHDISATGARIRLMDDPELPNVLMLLDVNELKTRKVSVIWRKQRDLGVRFM